MNLSQRMISVLQNIQDGRPPLAGLPLLRGVAGGTLDALRKRGLIDQQNRLTPAGINVLRRYAV